MMSKKKYDFVKSDSIQRAGRTLTRIRALKNFGGIKEGELGGYIQGAQNLSQEDTCWVYNGAFVYDTATVRDDAIIYGAACVFGNALIYGAAQVRDVATVRDNAVVYNNASISSGAKITGRAHVCGSARVHGLAQVGGQVQIEGCATIGGSAKVMGTGRISGSVRVNGFAEIDGYLLINGEAYITDEARIDDADSLCWFSNVGSENGTLTAYRTSTGIAVTRGCFVGDIDAFEQAVAKRHGGTQYATEYEILIGYIRLRLGTQSR